MLRTTQRTTNLTVILLGAGLSAVLVYALTSELFSKNSPTVLYNDACERIKTSPHVSPPPSTENRSLINRVVGRQVPSYSPCFPQQSTLFCASAPPSSTCSVTDSSRLLRPGTLAVEFLCSDFLLGVTPNERQPMGQLCRFAGLLDFRGCQGEGVTLYRLGEERLQVSQRGQHPL